MNKVIKRNIHLILGLILYVLFLILNWLKITNLSDIIIHLPVAISLSIELSYKLIEIELLEEIE